MIQYPKDLEKNGLLFSRNFEAGLIILLIFFGCVETVDKRLIGLLDDHRRHYPAMELDDVYKLIYQGTLGIEHLLDDTVAAKKYLYDEFRSVDPSEVPEEPLTEYVSGDSSWIRVNLRPFKNAQGNIQDLWRVIKSSSENWVASKPTFVAAWKMVSKDLSRAPSAWSEGEIRQFSAKMQQLDYPAIHHSERYSRAYKPAYRVVLKAEFDKLDHR